LFEVLSAKRLDARHVVPVERRLGARTTRFVGLRWLGEPHPNMEGVHGVEGRVPRGVLGVHLRCRHAARSEREEMDYLWVIELRLGVACR
jgi:hypothetical protein